MANKKFVSSEFDRRLGRIICLTRNRFGMSQKDLAKVLGISFQQIQKYESGENRVSANGLYKIARCFDMKMGDLLDGAQQKYVQEPDIFKTIEMMYKMEARSRRFILQIACSLVGETQPSPARIYRKRSRDNIASAATCGG